MPIMPMMASMLRLLIMIIITADATTMMMVVMVVSGDDDVGAEIGAMATMPYPKKTGASAPNASQRGRG